MIIKTKEECYKEAQMLLRCKSRCSPIRFINDNNGTFFPDQPYGFIYELKDGTIGFPYEIPKDDLSIFPLDIDINDNTHYFNGYLGDEKIIIVFKKSDVVRFYFVLGKTIRKTYWTGGNKLKENFNAFKATTELELLHIITSCKILSIKKSLLKENQVGFIKIGTLPYIIKEQKKINNDLIYGIISE